MSNIRVEQLHIYPVKSLAQVPVRELELDRYGAKGDRRWMLVDEQGKFLTQRQIPRLALIQAQWDGEGLQVTFPTGRAMHIANPGANQCVTVEIWGEQVEVWPCSDKVNHVFSEWLQRKCRLVIMPPEFDRCVDTQYARQQEQVNLSDGFPLLLISTASLAALNTRLEKPVPMKRFRPNIVVTGCDAFAEDHWRQIHVGNATLNVVKPCTRCAIPTIDTVTAEKDSAPLRALAAFRRQADGKVIFGQNLLIEKPGEIRIGDEVRIEC